MKNFEQIDFHDYKALFSKDWNILCVAVPSSQEGQFYDVTAFGDDGTVECDCKGYEYRKSCRHVLKVRALLGM